MGLEEVLNLTITANSETPTRAGFGVTLIMAAHTLPFSLRSYSDLPSMISDGFPLTHPAYLIASAQFSQNPRPTNVMIGKRSLPFTQVLSLTPTNLTVGYMYSFTVTDHNGLATPIQYVVQTSDTATIISTAIVALLSGISGVTAAVVSTHFTLTASTAGQIFALSRLPLPAYLKIQDTTTDPGIATDMTAIEAVDAGASWYAVTLDHAGKAEILALAAWVESRRKLATNNTSDYDVIDSASSSDVATTLKASHYVRSEVLGSYTATQQYSAAAWLGKMLPNDPGSATWAYKTLNGISPDTLTTSQKTTANTTKNANTYTTLGGINVTQWGKDEDGGYTDILIGTDWLFARLQEDMLALFANAKKIPYTDSGIDTVRMVVLNRLLTAAGPPFNILASSPKSAAPSVFFPKKADIDPAEVLARVLPDGTFTATYQGAIHTVVLMGTISF